MSVAAPVHSFWSAFFLPTRHVITPDLFVEPPAPTRFPRPVDLRWHFFCGQRHADHGRCVAHGGVDGLVVPGGVGTDGRVFAHVFAGPACRCTGRHHRPAQADIGRADGTGGRLCTAHAAGAGRLGRSGVGAVSGVCVWLLHGGADACMELIRHRPGSARRVAPGHHRREHRLQRRARRGAHAGRAGVCAAGCGLGVCRHGDHNAGDVGVHPPLAAQGTPTVQAARRAPGTHASSWRSWCA